MLLIFNEISTKYRYLEYSLYQDAALYPLVYIYTLLLRKVLFFMRTIAKSVAQNVNRRDSIKISSILVKDVMIHHLL